MSEVVSYALMFALGAIALAFSMNVMTDAREQSQDVGSAVQLKQVAQLTASNIQEAARVATAAPGARFETIFEIPAAVGGESYTVTIAQPLGSCEPADVQVETLEGALPATAPLGAATTIELDPGTPPDFLDRDCLDIGGSFDSSAGTVRVKYDGLAEPEIILENAPRVT